MEVVLALIGVWTIFGSGWGLLATGVAFGVGSGAARKQKPDPQAEAEMQKIEVERKQDEELWERRFRKAVKLWESRGYSEDDLMTEGIRAFVPDDVYDAHMRKRERRGTPWSNLLL